MRFQRPLFAAGDRVITPRGETARVLSKGPEGRIELRYEDALAERCAHVALLPKLLRRLLPGRRIPEPVRLKGW